MQQIHPGHYYYIRSFETLYANQIWFGDVMHGPKLMIDGRMRKVYLVSLMDDASRLITHSAFIRLFMST